MKKVMSMEDVSFSGVRKTMEDVSFSDVRKHAKSVSDDAWSRINIEFQRLKVLKNKKVSQVVEELKHRTEELQSEWENRKEEIKSEIESIRADVQSEIETVKTEIHMVKEDAKARFSWFWSWLPFYFQLFLFVGPVFACIWYVCSHHIHILWMGIVYIICLGLFLLWSLVVPSMTHRGIQYFSPYELNDEEEIKIRECIRHADKCAENSTKQGLWEEKDRNKSLFIVSLDGGGIKGILTVRILARICKVYPDFMNRVGLIAGCSTGSILAGMLATGFTPDQVVEMFRVASPVVFRTTAWEQLKHFGLLGGPQHDGEGKLKILETAFRGATMRDLTTGICITASHVAEGHSENHCKPRVWTNVVNHHQNTYAGHHEFDDEFKDMLDDDEINEFSVLDMKLADIVNGATAAPLYFQGAYANHTDGSLWSCAPSMAALATVAPVKDLKHVSMLSISTGIHINKNECSAGKWGLTQWLPWILDFFLNSTVAATHFNCKAMLQERYHRIDPILPRYYALNEVSSIDELIQHADAFDLSKTFKFLDRMGFKRKND